MASATHATLKNTSHTHLLEQKRDFSIKITSRICRFETCIVYLTYPNFKLSGLVSWERVTRIPGLHSKEHYGQTNNTKLQTLLSPSLKKRTAQELSFFSLSFFFFLFFVRTTTDWNHLSDDQVKAPTHEDLKRRIATQSTIWFTRLHSPSRRIYT